MAVQFVLMHVKDQRADQCSCKLRHFVWVGLLQTSVYCIHKATIFSTNIAIPFVVKYSSRKSYLAEQV